MCVALEIIEESGITHAEPTPILIDSIQSAIVVAKNPFFHARTKHIEVHHQCVTEQHNDGLINLIYCNTHDNVANIFTKALSREKFEIFCKPLRLF